MQTEKGIKRESERERERERLSVLEDCIAVLPKALGTARQEITIRISTKPFLFSAMTMPEVSRHSISRDFAMSLHVE